MAEETWLNHQPLMENAKDNKEKAKKDQDKHCEQVEYDWHQQDQHYKIELACHQAILN